jgi:hypothetical protein
MAFDVSCGDACLADPSSHSVDVVIDAWRGRASQLSRAQPAPV